MSITHAEFYRLLPKVLEKYQHSIKSSNIKVLIHDGSLIIDLSPQSIHKIGALELPSTKVTFQFIDVEQKEIDEFFNDFELTYRRGGG